LADLLGLIFTEPVFAGLETGYIPHVENLYMAAE